MFFYKKSTWQDSQGGRYEAYEVLRSVFCEDSQKWETVDATPAPVDSELFIRGEKHLFCIGKK